MSGEIINEWYFWVVSVAAGAAMAFVYDLLRLFRRIIRHNRVFVDIEDLIFWTACFFASFTLLYYVNNGVIRFAAVLGAAFGMWLHAMTLGRLLTPVSRIIKSVNKKITMVFSPIYRKYRLTLAAFKNRIDLRRFLKRSERKGEAEHGGQSRKKIKKTHTRISTRQK